MKNNCQCCPVSAQPAKPAPTLLTPLPIIGMTFERMGMNLVVPLPKSAQGHEYILIIINYATWYPEAVPLWKATSKNIARELVLLFSSVGLPKDLLTDQDMPFVSKLISDVCWLLQVKQLRTSMYHPQTNRLVKRFTQNLKRMLSRVVEDDERNWDFLLAIRETPQASTAFTPLSPPGAEEPGPCSTSPRRPGRPPILDGD